MILLYITK